MSLYESKELSDMSLMMRPQRKDANMPVIAPQRPTETPPVKKEKKPVNPWKVAFLVFLGLGVFGLIISAMLGRPEKETQPVFNPDVVVSEAPQQTEEPVTTEPSETTESEEDDVKNSNTPSFKQAIEDHLNEALGGNLKFDAWANHRQWELDGLTYVENKFTQDGKRHTYKARIGGDTIYFIAIDGDTIYWDEEGEDKFIDANSKN